MIGAGGGGGGDGGGEIGDFIPIFPAILFLDLGTLFKVKRKYFPNCSWAFNRLKIQYIIQIAIY